MVEPTVGVLFVCLGNICRSPTAQGLFEDLARRENLHRWLRVDSAGIGDWHVGEPPDARARRTALRRGIDLERQRARQVADADFETFDYILAMDHANLASLRRRSPPRHRPKIRLFMEYSRAFSADEVPDPYYGGPAGFDRVLDMLEDACDGLLAEIRSTRLG